MYVDDASYFNKEVVTLKDGKARTLLSDRDFKELIAEYMGYDALHYFEGIMQDCDDIIQTQDNNLEECENDIKEYTKELNKSAKEIEDLKNRIYCLEEIIKNR